jgi:hypothetical protein
VTIFAVEIQLSITHKHASLQQQPATAKGRTRPTPFSVLPTHSAERLVSMPGLSVAEMVNHKLICTNNHPDRAHPARPSRSSTTNSAHHICGPHSRNASARVQRIGMYSSSAGIVQHQLLCEQVLASLQTDAEDRQLCCGQRQRKTHKQSLFTSATQSLLSVSAERKCGARCQGGTKGTWPPAPACQSCG